MNNMRFKLWLEVLEAKREGIKGTILNFLKDKLEPNDDNTILNTEIRAIDSKILGDLMNHGLISTSDDDVKQDIQNRNGTIMDLIAKLAGGTPPQKFLVHNKLGEPMEHLRNEGVPAGWTPSGRFPGTYDDTTSAMMKIWSNRGKMPFNGNFVDSGVIQTLFRLDDKELDGLKERKLVRRDPDGWNIDQHKFMHFFKELLPGQPTNQYA
jgi:hypothetical protein